MFMCYCFLGCVLCVFVLVSVSGGLFCVLCFSKWFGICFVCLCVCFLFGGCALCVYALHIVWVVRVFMMVFV